MSAPVKKCEVTPLEALQRLIGAASMIDANECKDEVIYNVLQGELAVACRVAKDLAAAPVVPVAAQPVVPEGWKLVPENPTPKMVDATWGDDMAGMSHNKMNKHIYAAMLAAAPSLEAQPAGQVDQLEQVREAVLLYFDALTARQHGGVAQDKAFSKIQDALGLYWQFGVDHRAMAQGEKHEPT